jgi:uncharacterized protein (DUF58 family)
LAAGTLLSDTLILLLAALLFLYLLCEGALFHRAVNLAKESIRLESHPSTIETTVGRPFKVGTALTNSSHSEFSILRFSRSLPPKIDEVHTDSTLTLQSHGRQQIETLLRTVNPGKFEISTSTILIGRRTHIFTQAIALADEVIIIARPSVSESVDPIETTVLQELTVDHLRRGTGTDLAGIRPFNIHDDFHRIDWKATARTGKFMTRESYLEKEPTIILMVDISLSMNTIIHGASILNAFLNEAGRLLGAIRSASPIGLILYDNQRIITNIAPRQGVSNRERILRALLEGVKSVSAPEPLKQPAIRPYSDLARETSILTEQSAFAVKTQSYWEKLPLFANYVLPFYKKAESKYLERLGKQGVFKAFELVRNMPGPVLIIGVTNENSDLSALYEGAKNASSAGHNIVLLVLRHPVSSSEVEEASELEAYGIRVINGGTDQLTNHVGELIHEMGHSRRIRDTPRTRFRADMRE